MKCEKCGIEISEGTICNNCNNTLEQPEKKKMKTSTIVIIVVLAVLGSFVLFFVLPLISATKQTLGMFNQAKANTFVTEVQSIMDKAKISFMQDALNTGGTGIIYTNINGYTNDKSYVDRIEGDEQIDGKTYFVEFDRNAEYLKVVIYDENYCYDTRKQEEAYEEISIWDVNVYELYARGKNDGINGCTGSKLEM